MRIAFTTAVLAALAAAGCRGSISREPPVHLNPNMDFQKRYELQEENTFFKDGRAMRPQVAGTVAHGTLAENDVLEEHLRTGKLNGELTDELPMPLDAALLERGRLKFKIYCTPCHGGAGRGDGMVVQRGMTPPQSFLEPRVKAFPLGQIVQQITKGSENMPSYATQIVPADRWAVAAYVRALQVAQSPKGGTK